MLMKWLKHPEQLSCTCKNNVRLVAMAVCFLYKFGEGFFFFMAVNYCSRFHASFILLLQNHIEINLAWLYSKIITIYLVATV
ncbi:hypothetical protein EDC96DRAFT_527417 [Choanephora cucurbitarum]|nr:hypothetical protein EDC96DRAFT_528267 [Choanephora cucurbitarum]KAI8331125.1 hypothetical protein EDC96DRAFT_527417 [Choanephora cucurbitarum]